MLNLRRVWLGMLLVWPMALVAQPAVTGVSPFQHQHDAVRGTNIVATFNTNMSAPGAGAIAVHGQNSGRRTGAVTGGGTTQLTYDPAVDFHAGEEVEVSLTTGLQDNASAPLAAPFVYRFRTKTAATSGKFMDEQYLSPNNDTDIIAAADFDGDGDIDLATATVYGQNLIYLNDGTAGFATTKNWGTGTDTGHFVRTADVNGDGHPDLVQMEFERISVYGNDGAGTFTLLSSKTWRTRICACFSLADMDGDGDVDIVVASSDDQSYRPSVLPNDGSGYFGTPIPFALNTIEYWALETGDLDNDGDIDVALGQHSFIEVYLNDGSGNLTYLSKSGYSPSLQIEDIELMDVDNDGDLDYFAAAYQSESRWALNDGAGGFSAWATVSSTTKVTSIASADFNGDGFLDVALGSKAPDGSGTSRILFSNGSNFSSSGGLIILMGTVSVIVPADLNGDGGVDFAAATGSHYTARKDFIRLARIHEGALAAGPLVEPSVLSSAAGAPVDVFDFVVSDLGVASGVQLKIAAISLKVLGVGADFTWRITDGGALNCTGQVGVDAVAFNLSAAWGGLFPIPDSSSTTFTVSVESGTGAPQATDGQAFQVYLVPTGVFFGANGQFAPGQPQVDNGSGFTLDVAAVELRVLTQPPPQPEPGTPFPVQVAYTDAKGYRDLDVSGDVLSAARSDSGTIAQGATAPVAQGLADFSGANAVILGSPDNLNVQLVFTDDSGGSVAIAAPANSNSFALYSDDATSLLASGALAEPTQVDSVLGAAGFVDVLDFRIIDLGSGDGWPTAVTDVLVDLSGSSGDANDCTWQLSGPALSATGTVSGPVGSQSVQFSGIAISVPDGTQQTFMLSLQLAPNPGGTQDGQQWSMVIRTSGLPIVAGSSTSFEPGLPGVGNVTAPLAYEVTATRLVYLQQPPASINPGEAFPVAVAFQDSAGNLDLSVSGDTVEFARSDAGPITSGASAQATDGVATTSLELAGSAASIRLVVTDLAGGEIDLSGVPVESEPFDLGTVDPPNPGKDKVRGDGDDEESCSTQDRTGGAWWAICLLAGLALLRRRRA